LRTDRRRPHLTSEIADAERAIRLLVEERHVEVAPKRWTEALSSGK
jgi:hypothetical protein